MSIDYLNKNGLSYFWSKLKAYFAPKAHTHNAFGTKHSYTTAANAAKNWYRIANANTSQTDTTKPIHAQFILTAYNTSYDAGYYERWFVNAEVFGRNAHIIILGNQSAPFSQARILYENTIADLDANDRPAIDIYLNYALANGTTKIEIEEVYNNGGWTFVADGQISASTVPTGFESVACDGVRGNGVYRSVYSDWTSYTSLQRSNFTANFTLADNNTYRARVLNCTGTITVTVPSINSVNSWFIIKNFNTTSGVITIHPSTTSVLIDGSNANITLQPGEYIMIHSKAANAYTIVFDGRWKSQKADKGTTLSDYGITDAKIANGTITLGSNSITPLTSVPSHNQASNTITAMTGYSKPSSTSAIATSDTLNQAIGKLEKAIDDADISNTVHLTGNEFIGGIKEFGNSYCDSTREGETDWESSSLIIRYQNYIKGSGAPSANKHANLLFLDKIGNNVNWSGRLGAVESAVNSSGDYGITIACYKNERIDNVDTHDRSLISVGYDVDGIKFASCPSTSASRTSNGDIVTRDWIPKDTRIVHTTGNETIAGEKIFNTGLIMASNSPLFKLKDTDGEKGNTNAAWYLGQGFYDKNDKLLGYIYCGRYGGSTDKHNVIGLRAYKCNSASDTTYGQVFLNYYTTPIVAFEPENSNEVMLGRSSRKWKEIWCTQSSINSSSDERLKDDVAPIPDKVLDAWEGIDWVQYRFRDAKAEKGADARLHTGAVAQRIDEAFRAVGLDVSDYGLFLYDSWDAVPEAFGEDGVQMQKAQPAGDEYGLRYIEALCMEAAYMRRENARLKKRVADLEERLAALELKVS